VLARNDDDEGSSAVNFFKSCILWNNVLQLCITCRTFNVCLLFAAELHAATTDSVGIDAATASANWPAKT